MQSALPKIINLCRCHRSLCAVTGFFVVVLLCLFGPLGNVMLGFMFTGAIPGTSKNIPYWGMLSLYTSIVTGMTIYKIREMRQVKRATDKRIANVARARKAAATRAKNAVAQASTSQVAERPAVELRQHRDSRRHYSHA